MPIKYTVELIKKTANLKIKKISNINKKPKRIPIEIFNPWNIWPKKDGLKAITPMKLKYPKIVMNKSDVIIWDLVLLNWLYRSSVLFFVIID